MTNNFKRAILGTAQFGMAYGLGNWKQSLIPESDTFNVLERAWALGVRTLDTSPDYGLAERRIQTFLEDNPRRQFKIITKLKIKDMNNVEAEYENWLKKSIIMANKDIKKCVLIHNHAGIKSDFIIEKLDCLRAQRKIDEWGFSIYSPSLVPDILRRPGCEVVQLPYSILNPQVEMYDAMQTLSMNGRKVHARSIFTQGLIFKKRNGDAEPKELTEFRLNLLRYSEDMGIPVSAIALQFIDQTDWIDSFLIGADSVDQLDCLTRGYNCSRVSQVIEKLRILALKIPIDSVSPQTWNKH